MVVFAHVHHHTLTSAEKGSEHPLAKAIVTYGADSAAVRASETHTGEEMSSQFFLPIQDGSFKAVSGKGLSCIVNNKHEVAVGSPSFIEAYMTEYHTAQNSTTR